jgi:hypothetical protein
MEYPNCKYPLPFPLPGNFNVYQDLNHAYSKDVLYKLDIIVNRVLHETSVKVDQENIQH